MGKVVLHMMKIKSSGVRGIQSHNNREHPPRTNPDIDPTRTKENYQLREQQSYTQTIKREISKHAPATKTVRKDAVVLCNFIVTSDEKTMKAMSKEIQRQFFKDTVEWFAARYGHIVNATVHMDEKTPHMHLGLVPITGGKLCCKELFTRKELHELQTDFARDVGARYDLERGEEGSERTHLSEIRFKAKCAEEQAQEAETLAREAEGLTQGATVIYNDMMDDVRNLQSKIESLRIERNKASQEAKEAHYVLDDVQAIKKAIQGKIDALQGTLEDLQEKVAIVDETLRQKNREGVSVSGGMGEWQKRLADAKEKADEINRLRLMERFISHPQIKPFWEEFNHPSQRGKGLDRDR